MEINLHGYFGDQPVKSMDQLSSFDGLKSLTLNFSALSQMPSLAFLEGYKKLEWLRLTDVPKGRLTLPFIPGLKQLVVSGSKADLSPLGHQKSLLNLELTRVLQDEIGWLSQMQGIESLVLAALNIRSLEMLQSLPIRKLQLNVLSRISNLDAVCEIKTLEQLALINMHQIESLPDFSPSTRLKCIAFGPMKNLSNIEGLMKAPALEEIRFFDVPKLKPKSLRIFTEHPSIKIVSAIFGSKKRQKEAEGILGNLLRHDTLQTP